MGNFSRRGLPTRGPASVLGLLAVLRSRRSLARWVILQETPQPQWKRCRSIIAIAYYEQELSARVMY